MCLQCRHTLGPLDLIPVVSWLWLRGKCRYCHKRIPDTPLAELLTPVIFLLSYAFWPKALSGFQLLTFSLWLVFVVGLVALFVYDLRWQQLPNRVIFPLLALAALQTVVAAAWGPEGARTVLMAAFWGLVCAGGIFWALFRLSDGKWIGGGDVKLGWLIGLLVGGPVMSLLVIFIASLFGTVVGLPLMAGGRLGKKHRLPFGPFLIVAAIIVRLFGAGLMAWYERQVGL
jgi:prepilin signal peptidase PulO-like enzyme (type II secretory pathway)